ncbi:MAG: hypothetical protein SH850_23595 [Planctomycetaceae bacterium]|nr:hypothetical protein [Planctomycetaceae bacterium]
MEWTSRYEELRQQILQPAGQSFSAGHGLTVLLQRGVTAWMRVWSDCALPFRITSSVSGSATAGSTSSVSDLSDQWTRLLVDMLLHHSQEVHA